MFVKLTQSPEFIETLYKIDKDFFELSKEKTPCPCCGGKLDASNYLRKPRGGPLVDVHLSVRFSLCCRQDGCRKRFLPSSVRFYKGFLHWLPLVLLSALFLNPSPNRRKRLMNLLDVSIETIKRWEVYWSQTFPNSTLHKDLKEKVICGHCPLKAVFQSSLSALEVLKLFKNSVTQT